MTAKEKAEELVDKMLDSLYDNGSLSFKRILFSKAKQCALIAVDELIYETQFEVPNIRQRYWQKVKKEISNL